MLRSNAWCAVGLVLLVLCGVSGCPPPDVAPPEDVSAFSAQALDSRIDLSWTNPADSDFSGVKIQRKTGGYPTADADGQTVYNGPGQSASDTGLVNGVPCYYVAFAYDKSDNYSGGVKLTSTPISGTAKPEILRQFSSVVSQLDLATGLPSGELDALKGELGEAQLAYEGADPCGAAQHLGAYEALAQDYRQAAGADEAKRGTIEALYNLGRQLRYDMIAGTSAKDLCPGQERVGEIATAAADEAQSDNVKCVASTTFGEPRLLTAQAGGETFTKIEVPGAPATSGDFGVPGIPFVSRLIGVPQDADVELEVTTEQAESFHANLFPVQNLGMADRENFTPVTPPANVNSFVRSFSKDASIYSTDRPFPAQVATAQLAGAKRGLRIYSVRVAGGQYNPVSQEVTLYKKIDIKATFKNGKTYFVNQAAFGPFESAAGKEYGGMINGAIIGRFADQTIVQLPDDGEEFLILTHPDFYDDCVRLAAWKNQNGMVTHVHTVCDGAGPGEDTPDAIRNYIISRYTTKQIRPSYVLLMGDLQHIPPFYVPSRIDPSSTICTDFPYSKLVEQSFGVYNLMDEDVIADAAVGRVPAEISWDATSYVNADIAYEKTPPTKPSYYKRVTLASHFQCCQQVGFWSFFGQEQMPFMWTMEGIRNVLTARGYEAQRIYKETIDAGDPSATPPWPAYTGDPTPCLDAWGNALSSDIGPGSGFNWNGNNTDVINAWKDGRFLIMHFDHGWPGGWWAPLFTVNDMHDSLYSKVADRPFVFSINCSSGLIDQKLLDPNNNGYNFVQLLFWAPGQTMGIIASTRTSWSTESSALTRGYVDALFPETLDFGPSNFSFPRFGDVLCYGASALIGEWPSWFGGMRDHVMMYQCYGDPTVAIRTENPYPFYLPESVDLQLNGAALEALYSVDGATLTVMRASPASGELTPVGRGIVHNGVADIKTITDVNANEELSVAIGAPNAIPVRTTVQVKPRG